MFKIERVGYVIIEKTVVQFIYGMKQREEKTNEKMEFRYFIHIF